MIRRGAGRAANVVQPLVGLALVGAFAAALLAFGALLAEPSLTPAVVATSFVVLVLGASALAPRYVLYLLIVWLVGLGLLRRIFDQFAPSGDVDPLLVVAPAAVIALLVPAAAGGAFRNLSALAKAVAVLSGLALLGALNPVQGNLTAGLAGLLFVLAPTLAFWVGRGILDDAVAGVVFKLLAVLGIGVAAYGLEQTFAQFRPWDAAWIAQLSGYKALSVGGVTRAFGTFASAQEYALFLAIGIAIWLAYTLRSLRLPFGLAAIGLLGTALVYASARGTIFTLVLALGLMAAARLRLSFALAAILGALVIVMVTVGAGVAPSSIRSTEAADGGPAELLAHQLEGLAEPFDRDSSTLGLHYELVKQGVTQAFAAPFGLGVSTVSLAGARFGEVALLTETDPSNMAVALGLPGFATYLVIVVLAFREAYALALRRRDTLSLIALAVLAITLFQWLNGGLYAVSTLTWLVLGWVDRSWARPGSSDEPDG